MGVRLGVGGGFQQGSPTLSSAVRCYVCFLFLSAFYNPERHSGNEPQSHTLGCPLLLCAHAGLGGGWGGVLPQPPSTLFLQATGPGGAQLVRTLSGGAGGHLQDFLGPRGRPQSLLSGCWRSRPACKAALRPTGWPSLPPTVLGRSLPLPTPSGLFLLCLLGSWPSVTWLFRVIG